MDEKVYIRLVFLALKLNLFYFLVPINFFHFLRDEFLINLCHGSGSIISCGTYLPLLLLRLYNLHKSICYYYWMFISKPQTIDTYTNTQTSVPSPIFILILNLHPNLLSPFLSFLPMAWGYKKGGSQIHRDSVLSKMTSWYKQGCCSHTTNIGQ